jgi:hypothetical protein
MPSVFSMRRVTELQHKLQLCDSFIEKDIDVAYYSEEKSKAQKELDSIIRKKSITGKLLSAGVFSALFIMLFFLVLYILKQLI